MNRTCPVCGYTAEPAWRDGKYYCNACGNEINITQAPVVQPPVSAPEASAYTTNAEKMIIHATCPICKNSENNYLKDGKCRCSLCGTAFALQQQNNYNPEPHYSGTNNYATYSSQIANLEKEKNRRLILGIVWLILFWPVCIYHFYKMYQVSQEISRLRRQSRLL